VKYPYRKFPLTKIDPVSRLNYAWRPALKVILWYSHKHTVPLIAILDTGADHCIFDAQIGQQLGVPVTRGDQVDISGIGGGPIVGFMHTLSISVAGCNYKSPIVFAYNIPATGILGQTGFFDHFVARFDWTPDPPCFDIQQIPRN
jgi:hypothetical protein